MIRHPSTHIRIERDIRCIGSIPPPAKVCLLVAATLVVVICSSPITSAAPIQPNNSDPLVDVVVDATPVGCTLALTHNALSNTSQTEHIPCAPYTLAKSVTMKRSEAIAKHLQYVLRPDQNAPASAWQQETQALSQIASSQHDANSEGVQSLSCTWGGTWSQEEGWPTINSDNLDITISWYTTSDCTGVYLQTAVVRGITAPKILYLLYEEYEICCPIPVRYSGAYVGTNTLVDYLPGDTVKYPNGHNFGYDFSDGYPSGPHEWFYDLGPLY